MTNDKDSAVLAERVERVTKWLDGGCSTWGTPMQDIREILNALRQPTQSDALRDQLLQECLVKLRDVQGTEAPKQYACNLIKRIERVLQEQSK